MLAGAWSPILYQDEPNAPVIPAHAGISKAFNAVSILPRVPEQSLHQPTRNEAGAAATFYEMLSDRDVAPQAHTDVLAAVS